MQTGILIAKIRDGGGPWNEDGAASAYSSGLTLENSKELMNEDISRKSKKNKNKTKTQNKQKRPFVNSV